VKGKQALLFEKRSKNFYSLGFTAEASAIPTGKEFFGSFFKKRTACFLSANQTSGR
jgi:hypothetical protein